MKSEWKKLLHAAAHPSFSHQHPTTPRPRPQSSAPAASVTAEVTTTNGDGSAVSCVDIPLTVSVADKLPLTLSHEVELTTELVDNMFATFKKQFNKVYDNKEEHGMRR